MLPGVFSCFLVYFLSASQIQAPAVLDGSSDKLCCIFSSLDGLVVLSSVVTMGFESGAVVVPLSLWEKTPRLLGEDMTAAEHAAVHSPV